MRRYLVVPVVLLLAGCASSHSVQHAAGKVTVHVKPGTRKVFASGALRAGDKVICGRNGFSAVVQRPGSAVSAGSGRARQGGHAVSQEIEIQNNGDGTVVVKCDS